MSKTNNNFNSTDNELTRLFGRKRIGINLFTIHWSLLICAIYLFIIGRWELGLTAVFVAILFVLIAYRIAGGKQNPSIWKDKGLYDLLKHVVLSGKARIGFHFLRDQKLLLNKLESIGIEKKISEDIRQFIRDEIIKDQRVFDIFRDNIIIEMIHGGKEWFWDGYGNRKTAQYFHEAEIIFKLNPSVDYMFLEVLKGLKGTEGLVC